MALPYRGGVHYPNPAGLSDRVTEGQIPGILGFKSVDLSGGKATAKAVTTVSMPPPWNNSTGKRVGRVPWKLGASQPAVGDVLQGGLPNCPVAAIIAALANTTVGRKYLNEIVTEYRGVNVKTQLSPEIIKAVNASTDGPDYKQQVPEIVSDRYFKVSFWKGPIPDTFYVEYADNDYAEPVFMGSPTDMLWPAVIEKACAYHYGSYKELGDYKKHTANEQWLLVVGTKPQVFKIEDTTGLEAIESAATRASQVPTIGASKDDAKKVTPNHAFAILGRSGSNIEMYNPYGKHLSISPKEFRDEFQMILSGAS